MGKNWVRFETEVGRFLIKTLTHSEDLKKAYLLRYQVFQMEMVGMPESLSSEDRDEFDEHADHLAIFDKTTNQMIATCRLINSEFSKQFYSEQEFECRFFLERPETKLEIGRVCVHPHFRRSIIIMLLWRGIAEYMVQSKTQILFGCGSIPTLDPKDSALLYRYLISEKKLSTDAIIHPSQKYRSDEFDDLLVEHSSTPLLEAEKSRAVSLIPPLCRSYFDIGCIIAGPPAFDREFKCIDFLTILEVKNLPESLRQKMFGNRL